MENRKYSIQEFLSKTSQEKPMNEFFELETPRLLNVHLGQNGFPQQVWAKVGSMITYDGNVKFEREGVLEHGIEKFFKKALTGEGTSLMKASGKGTVSFADQGKKVSILYLEGDAICINGNDLLVFDSKINWDIKMMRRVAGMMSGGLFNVRCEGHGMVAMTTHYEPVTIPVTPDRPVFTDPNATVAWSGNLQPDIQTDINLRTLLGRGSGETFQMKFQGSGFVVVQPFEEIYYSQS